MFLEAANREKEAGMDDNIYTEEIPGVPDTK